MAKVKLVAAFESISGAMTKINKKSQHAGDQKMVLLTHRTAASENPNCQNIYLRGLSSVTRTTPLTTKETEARSRFEAVAKAVKQRKGDLMQMSTDQQAFLAQKDKAGGKKTLRAYLWLVCGQEYDAAHNG